MQNKFLRIFFSIIFIFFVVYFFVYSSINNNNLSELKKNISHENKFLIKKFFFPFKYISELENEILQNKSRSHISEVFFALKKELDFQKSLKNFKTKEKKIVILPNNQILKKYDLTSFFHAGINNTIPGSGYLDFHDDKLIILSARGILGYADRIDNQINFKQIKNNLNQFIGIEQFKKNSWFSFKDILVHDNKIFISFTEEIKRDCWNTSLVFAKFDIKEINFKSIFSSDNCIHSKNNPDQEFNAHQSGGKIISFDKSHVLLTIGDYRSRFLSQDKNSVNGKIIKLNLDDKSYKIFSMGHRNPQGLYFDVEKNIILETEHGPKGGDEINLINLNLLKKENIPNYGWPVSSAGEHYKDPKGDKYIKYPLYKSHSEHGFIEPIKSFVPSIGISEISKINQKKYVVSSLGKKTLYFFDLSHENKITNLIETEVFERIRDLKFYNNKLYLFLEDTPSIGIIDFK